MTPEQMERAKQLATSYPPPKVKGAKPQAKPKKATTPAGGEPAPRDPVPVDVYYEAMREKFWTLNAAKEWMPVSKTTCELILRSNWYSQYEKTTNSLTRVEAKLLDVIMHHNVKYAGEMAGWPSGLHTICGNRVLISRGPKLIEPKRGNWPLLKSLIAGLLRDEARYFYGWMRAAYESLQAGPPFGPGQLLAIAGPTGCGKSLLQRLITVMLGGRMAKPYDYLMGETNFNDNMIASEHLVLDDEVGKADIRTRKHFGAKLKSTVANQEANAHPKGGKAFTIEPFWRISITLNDEPENLMVLPPIDSDIEDKVILLRATHAEFPYPSPALPSRQDYWNALNAEVPAYLHALLRWPIPDDMKDLRYGMKKYQNADLMFALSSLSPEYKLWNLILQSGVLSNSARIWSGTASDLEAELQKTSVAKQVSDLLYFSTAAGVYLGRLAKSQPGNVEKEIGRANKTIFHLAAEIDSF